MYRHHIMLHATALGLLSSKKLRGDGSRPFGAGKDQGRSRHHGLPALVAFHKRDTPLAALVYYKAGRIDEAKEHLAMICKPRNMLFLYLASNAKLKTLFDELKKHNE